MQSRAKNRRETGPAPTKLRTWLPRAPPGARSAQVVYIREVEEVGPGVLGLTVEQSRPIMCLHSFSGLGPLYQRAHWGDGEGGAKKDLKPRYHRESTFMLLAVTEKMQLCIPDAFF